LSGFTATIGQDFEYFAVFATSPSCPITTIKFLSEKMKEGRYTLSTVLFFTTLESCVCNEINEL
jgi:hypothetical protein